jgi:catechol 2,3-dioxygenase-like lactoylglutathione lyase family enzyme
MIDRARQTFQMTAAWLGDLVEVRRRRSCEISAPSLPRLEECPMIEHVSVPVSNIRKSKTFYAKALKPLGYAPWMAYADAVGFVEGGHARLWIGKQPTVVPMHVAFLAPSRKAVRDFHAAALKAGGKNNGKPGYRDYSPDYYAAFVYDPDGNNIEAVWYDPARTET